jgi:hypothetical protein
MKWASVVAAAHAAGEPSEAEYYGMGAAAKPFTIPRVSNLTYEQFIKYAAMGQPIIVTDVTKDWPMHGMDCKKFATVFKDGAMRREYNAEVNPEDLNDVSISDYDKWMTDSASSGTDAQGVDGAPTLAPFYWGAKEGESGEPKYKSQKKMLERVQKLTVVPSFMSPDNKGAMDR